MSCISTFVPHRESAAARFAALLPADIALCIFDLDGTLADSLADIAFAINTILKKNNMKQVSLSYVKDAVGTGARDLVARCYAEALEYDGALNAPERYAADAAFSAAVDMLLSEYRREYKIHCTDATHLYPGTADMLLQLQRRGILLAVLSNKPKSDSVHILNTLGVSDYFFAVLGPESTGKRKPDPAGIFAVMQQAAVVSGKEIDRSAVLMAGDSDIDILTGKAAGVRTAAIGGGFCSAEKLLTANPDILV